MTEGYDRLMPYGSESVYSSPIHQAPHAMHQAPQAMHQVPPAIHQAPQAMHQVPPAIHQAPMAPSTSIYIGGARELYTWKTTWMIVLGLVIVLTIILWFLVLKDPSAPSNSSGVSSRKRRTDPFGEEDT